MLVDGEIVKYASVDEDFMSSAAYFVCGGGGFSEEKERRDAVETSTAVLRVLERRRKIGETRVQRTRFVVVQFLPKPRGLPVGIKEMGGGNASTVSFACERSGTAMSAIEPLFFLILYQ